MASMSKVTSICGTPRGAGGMPTSWNTPSSRLSRGHGALALVDLDLDRGLVVGRRREDLALARRDRRVALDQLGEHAAQRFDAERQRRHVEQQHVLHFAAQHAALHRRADRDHFVRVHALVRLLAEQVADQLLHLRDTRRAADQHDFVDLRAASRRRRPSPACRARPSARRMSSIICSKRARVSFIDQVLGAGGVGRDERQVDFGLEQRRKLDLGLFGGFLQALQGHLVFRDDRCPVPS